MLTTDGRYRTQAAEQVEKAGVGRAGRHHHRPGDRAAQGRPGGAGRRGDRPHRPRGRQRVSWSAQRDLGRTARCRPARRHLERGRGAAGEKGRRRDRPDGARRGHRRRRPLRGAARSSGQGVTEEQFALELDTAMRRGGAEEHAPSRPSSRRARTRPSPTTAPVSAPSDRGDPVVVDFGATFEGYRSDMTRTFCVGGGARPASWPGSSPSSASPRRPASPRCGPASAPRRSTTSAARSSPRRAGPSASSTAPGTASASTSTRPRRSASGHCYPRPRLRRHRRARCVPSRARRGPCRGHPRRDRGRLPPPDPIPEGHRCLMAVSTNDLQQRHDPRPPRGPVHAWSSSST